MTRLMFLSALALGACAADPVPRETSNPLTSAYSLPGESIPRERPTASLPPIAPAPQESKSSPIPPPARPPAPHEPPVAPPGRF